MRIGRMRRHLRGHTPTGADSIADADAVLAAVGTRNTRVAVRPPRDQLRGRRRHRYRAGGREPVVALPLAPCEERTLRVGEDSPSRPGAGRVTLGTDDWRAQ